MRVLVSGSTGFLGSAVCAALANAGDRVVRLVRRPARRPARGTDEVSWDPAAGSLDSAALEGLDAVVHLAGENIATRRWSAAQKERIRSSRVRGTELLARALLACARPPRAWVGFSAIGYYGDRGDQVMTEASAPGSDFLATTCLQWEAAAQPLAAHGVRVALLRCGVVLAAHGGALHRMLKPFRLGLGGVLGSGRQYVSWIALEDVVAIVRRMLSDAGCAGVYNATAPHPVTNRELTRALGRALHRPTVLPVPAFAVRLLFGEMGEALLLSSTRVVPARLLASGHEFRWPEIEGALRNMLARS